MRLLRAVSAWHEKASCTTLPPLPWGEVVLFCVGKISHTVGWLRLGAKPVGTLLTRGAALNAVGIPRTCAQVCAYTCPRPSVPGFSIWELIKNRVVFGLIVPEMDT